MSIVPREWENGAAKTVLQEGTVNQLPSDSITLAFKHDSLTMTHRTRPVG